LLDGERISHSCFKIPLSIHEDFVAGLKHNSYMFTVLQQTKVIIWDKVPMQHKYNIDTVDQCLRDLLEVSNYLHLIALELTYYYRIIIQLAESQWYLEGIFVRLCLWYLREHVNK